ncbi:hypothetical protein ACQKMN_04160 [Ureibacillus composti]
MVFFVILMVMFASKATTSVQASNSDNSQDVINVFGKIVEVNGNITEVQA